MPQPSPDLLAWVCRTLGPRTTVIGVQDLKKHQGPQPVWSVQLMRNTQPMSVVLKAGPLSWQAGFRAEAAALEFATSHRLPTPRLLGADLDGLTGMLALLTSVVEGTAWQPRVGHPPSERLRTLGRAAAGLHAIQLTERSGFPQRLRPIPHDDYTAERAWAARYQAAGEASERVFAELLTGTGWPTRALRHVVENVRTTPLISRAEQRIASIRPPAMPSVFVHGDLHAAQTLWHGARLTAIVDWDSAGCGHPGVDLGSLRLDAALHFGPTAPEEIVQGWQEVAGTRAGDTAYWDVVAALQTAADVGDQTSARDEFLQSALDRL